MAKAELATAVDVAEVFGEASPAVLAIRAAVAEFSIYDERDDVRTAIDDCGDVMSLADLDEADIAIPTILGATIMEDDRDGAAIGDDKREALPFAGAGIEDHPTCFERIELQGEIDGEAGAELFRSLIG